MRCLLRAGLDENENAVFGDFIIERRGDGTLWELGRGAMGITYRANDTVLNRTVALKVIETPSAIDYQPVRERFLREARAAAALRHHNIAGVFQFGASPEGDRCYCAMELVDGETLETVVRRNGPLRLDLVLDIAVQVTRALIAAAERGLVHRDLKPGNIMLAGNSENGQLQVKVIDFGLAKAANAAGEMELTHGGFVGTPAFASPEQFAHGAIDARTDIYALGVTIWFALTGRLPFAGTTIEEIRQRQARNILPNEQLKSRAVPQFVIEPLQLCLALDPAQRPASARELMSALETCRAQVAAPETKRTSMLIALVCVIAVIVGAALWLQHKRSTAGDESSLSLENPNAPAKATESGEAYLLFLRARAAELSHRDSATALDLYQQAIATDPSFALARARFSITATQESRLNNDQTLAKKARAEAEEGMRLQPNLGDVYVAMAFSDLYQEHDPVRALLELHRAAKLSPNSAEVQLVAAFAYKEQNKFRERIAALRRAEALDPTYGDVRTSLVLTLRWVRDWKEAMVALDRRLIVTSPSSFSPFVSPWRRANDEFRLTGAIEALKQALAKEEQMPGVPLDWLNYERFEIAMFKRDFTGAAHFLSEIPAAAFEYPMGVVFDIAGHSKVFREALLAVASGAESAERKEKLERAEHAISPDLPTPHDPYDTATRLVDLAIIHAFGGRKQEAIREATQAVGLLSVPETEIEKNELLSALALVYAQTGEPEKAVDLIEHLLTVPCLQQRGAVYNMALIDLKWRWEWDPLRNNPRFQKLVAGTEPKTAY